MKETEQTLLDQIKEQVAKEKCKRPFNHLSGQDLRQCIDAICERYATAKAKASCEATLKKAFDNCISQTENCNSTEFNRLSNILSNIGDPSNIVIL